VETGAAAAYTAVAAVEKTAVQVVKAVNAAKAVKATKISISMLFRSIKMACSCFLTALVAADLAVELLLEVNILNRPWFIVVVTVSRKHGTLHTGE